jgi:hypothetical protein
MVGRDRWRISESEPDVARRSRDGGRWWIEDAQFRVPHCWIVDPLDESFSSSTGPPTGVFRCSRPGVRLGFARSRSRPSSFRCALFGDDEDE